MGPRSVITIVSGLPRSGTSLMMQMLGAGGMDLLVDECRSADESNPRGYFEYEPVARTRTDVSWVEGARGRVVKVVAPLLTFLPEGECYRIIFMERDLDEVLRSQSAMLERAGRRGAALAPGALRTLLERQVATSKEWINAGADRRGLFLEYHDLLRASAAAVASIAAFLERSLDEGAMRAVIDPSLNRAGRAR